MKPRRKEQPCFEESNTQSLGNSPQSSVSGQPVQEPAQELQTIADYCRRAIATLTASVYPRHSPGCPKRADRYWRRCDCWKWIYLYDGKTGKRFSAKTRSWSRAERIRQSLEDCFDPVRAQLKKQEAKRVTIADAVTAYLSDVAARTLAPSTQEDYRWFFCTLLLPWAERNRLRYLDDLATPQLTRLRSSWQHLAAQTVYNRQQIQKTFYGFCIRQGWLDRNHARLLSPIHVKRTPTGYFNKQEFEKLVQATYSFGKGSGHFSERSFWAVATRLLTMLLLLRWSGLRITDAVTLERTRLVGDKLFLHQAKTGVPVFVPLPAEVAEALRQVPPGRACSPGYFFWTGNGKRMHASSQWQRAFRRLFQIADLRNADGTPKRCHIHMLRDTFAIENLLAGIPIDQVSVLLGHSSIKTTEKYYGPWVIARQQQLEQSIRKAHLVAGITKSVTRVDSGTLPFGPTVERPISTACNALNQIMRDEKSEQQKAAHDAFMAVLDHYQRNGAGGGSEVGAELIKLEEVIGVTNTMRICESVLPILGIAFTTAREWMAQARSNS